MDDREVSVSQLARERYRLSRAIEELIGRHRQAMRLSGYQRTLFGPHSQEFVTSPENALVIGQERYAPNWYYEGPYKFQKHAFPQVGQLDHQGEEFQCAQLIDGLPEVRRWVRNLERRPGASFWLQTATDKFYPDFVVELVDDRILVVEYKGEHLWSNDDSKEKRVLGELWADRSDGKCLFVMPRGPDWTAIKNAVTR